MGYDRFDIPRTRRNVQRDAWYDTAQICRAGHVINASSTKYPEHNQKFCATCGQQTITQCETCHAPIKGEYHVDGVWAPSSYAAPKRCAECGAAFPWTEVAEQAAIEYAAEVLDKADSEVVAANIADVIQDTPRAPVAALKLKKVFAKAGPAVASTFRDILVGVVSGALLKAMFG